MHGLTFKDGVLPIATIAKAGARILSALDITARRLKIDLVITCADKDHLPTDPHSLGEAYDVRTHGFDGGLKLTLLRAAMLELSEQDDMTDAPIAASGGIGTHHFWGWIEHPGEASEHLHVQRRHGTIYA